MPLADPIPGTPMPQATTWVTRPAPRGFRERYRKVGTFATGTGTLIPGTPIYRTPGSGEWRVWANGHPVHGFVVKDDVVLDAVKTVQGIVLLRGDLKLGEIVVPVGNTLAELKVYLQDGLIELDLQIDDLAEAGPKGFGHTHPAFIPSTAVVYQPSIHATITVSPSFIASGAQVFNPTIS